MCLEKTAGTSREYSLPFLLGGGIRSRGLILGQDGEKRETCQVTLGPIPPPLGCA